MFVDDLFERIQEPSTALTARYPKVDTVWEPLDDGSWRGAHPRTPASTTVEPGGLPKEALERERIARVRKRWRRKS